MGTIEERAKEYAHQYRRDAHDLKGERADAAFAAYCQGAEDERKELTRWHDPKERLPENNVCVLLKVVDELDNEALYLGSRAEDIYITDLGISFCVYFDDESMPDMNAKVIGWREIHE